jgi:glycosyltransferase involved in cell wall biosynthesis
LKGKPLSKGTISWFSNSPHAATGYGQQTSQVVSRLARDGYDVAVLSNYGREGGNGSWLSPFGDQVTEYGRGFDAYSQDVTAINHVHWKSKFPKQRDVLITLYDVWIMADKYQDLNIASWTPVDHSPIPPKVLEWLQKSNVTPIAMSKFGKAEIERHGVESLYVPHAVEDVFQPTFKIEGKPTREYMGLKKSEFVVGMNAANKASGSMHRKALAENFLAFALFAKDKPDAVLYLHTDVFGAAGGWNIPTLLQACGLKKEQVLFVDQLGYRYGYTQAELAALYTTMDVYLGCSYGEGFGVGTIEAQACGTRVIVSDFAASAELCGDGWKVGGQPFWDAAQATWFNVPNVAGIVQALEEAYAAERGTSDKALKFAEQYGADFVYENHWKPVLAKLLA